MAGFLSFSPSSHTCVFRDRPTPRILGLRTTKLFPPHFFLFCFVCFFFFLETVGQKLLSSHAKGGRGIGVARVQRAGEQTRLTWHQAGDGGEPWSPSQPALDKPNFIPQLRSRIKGVCKKKKKKEKTKKKKGKVFEDFSPSLAVGGVGGWCLRPDSPWRQCGGADWRAEPRAGRAGVGEGRLRARGSGSRRERVNFKSGAGLLLDGHAPAARPPAPPAPAPVAPPAPTSARRG